MRLECLVSYIEGGNVYCDLTLSSDTKLSDFRRNDLILMVTKASRAVSSYQVNCIEELKTKKEKRSVERARRQAPSPRLQCDQKACSVVSLPVILGGDTPVNTVNTITNSLL